MSERIDTVAEPIYQLKITLEGIQPPVWRQVLVPGDFTLGDLHEVIQATFGWWDYHLHQFIVGETYYASPDVDDFEEFSAEDEDGVTLRQVAPGEGFAFRYQYDFGDDWLHHILVEEIGVPEPGKEYPVVVDGQRACPPEDVGGIWGYENFLRAIADPEHEEHEEFLEWVGGEFDPEAFDLDETNETLWEWGEE